MNATQTICTHQSNTDLPNINAREISGVLYFTVDRGNNGKEYWKTDGTPQGTLFIAKI